jgi:Holliday junction DNA helicase RuvA
VIGRLSGTIVERAPNRLILDVAGVGYRVHIPLSTFYGLPGGTDPRVSLHVHTHVRDDAIELFGFATSRERSVFERLIAIAGVGPRLALAILSGIGVDELRDAVARQDRERLQKIPGVGRKTGERLLLELRDKLGDVGPAVAVDPQPVAPGAVGVRDDAVSALVNLGYAREVAQRAVEKALEAGAPGSPPSPVTLEAVLRRALAGLVR